MIYLDNSATSYPKPKNVLIGAHNAMIKYSFNSGRGGYRESVNTSRQIFEVRKKVSEFFGVENAENVTFTQNCTYALNTAIKGCARKSGHIIISSLEHNAVARPVHKLYETGKCDYDIFEYSPDTQTVLNRVKSLIKPNTNMIVITGASNVFGVMLPVAEICKLAKENGIRIIVDAAQTAGIIDMKADKMNFDILCAPGHKALYSEMGVGFSVFNCDLIPETIIEGGTGSNSKDLKQPDFLPDRFEAGTLNNSGIISLGSGIDFINSRGINNIFSHEKKLQRFLYEELSGLDDVVLYVDINKAQTVPIISFNYKDYSSEKCANLLAGKNIAVRAGYHCSPLAHRTFKTQQRGTVRLSPGAFTTLRDCENFLNVLKKI